MRYKIRAPLVLFALIWLCAIMPVIVQAQTNLSTKKIPVKDTLQFDSLSVIAESVIITDQGKLLDSSQYSINAIHSIITWNLRPAADSVEIRYRTFPLSFNNATLHKKANNALPDETGRVNPFAYTPGASKNEVFKLKGLSKQGSISRGISFGNNQDLSVNSNLNLQLSGQITNKIGILAAITDENIPIQADGNTQQLQEFDQVYIQLFTKRSKLIAGDFQLRSHPSHYMKYFKKGQGGSFQTNFDLGKKKDAPSMSFRASGGVSRGKFSRNVSVNGSFNNTNQEGNQGPYRLIGSEGETYIIVLSGTERIYIDGKQLLRGQENDYVIDYNTAEVTFTARQLITKDKRISIEFQYTDQSYTRSFVQVSDEFRWNKLRLNFDVYSEQDAKDAPINQELTEGQKRTLEAIGDNLDSAITSSIQQVEFDVNRVLYKLESVHSCGDSVFVYSNNPDSAVYQLTFSKVGQGNGNYVQITSSANGKVFEWTPPDAQCSPQGEYAPIIRLVTPKHRLAAVIGGEYGITKNTKINFEGALSNNDQNLFSSADSQDDLGYAFKVDIATQKNFGDSDSTRVPWVLSAVAGYEYVHQNFSSIERFREVEFYRNWNLRNITLQQTSHIPKAIVGIGKKGVGNLNYEFNSFISENNEFNGYRNLVTSKVNYKGFALDFYGSTMHSGGTLNNTEFIRNKTKLSKSFKWFTIGLRDDYERNRYFYDSPDSLLANSYEFFEWEVFVTNPDTFKNKFKIGYTQRRDLKPKDNRLVRANLGQSLDLSFDIINNSRNKLRGKASYRTLTINDETLSTAKPENTLLGRLEYNLKILRNAISFTTFYEVGSGLEIKKEFSYIQVIPGQGTHIHRDYNDNGIQELDEFEIASGTPSESPDFIKVFTPTTEYVKALTNQFKQSFRIRPGAVWGGKKGVRKFIARFSDQFTFRTDRKTNEGDLSLAYNPFNLDRDNVDLITLNYSFRNTLYFNQTHPKFGFSYNVQDIQGKTLLTNGFESRSNSFQEIDIRWNISKLIMVTVRGTYGQKTNRSAYFSNRDFDLGYGIIKPKITLQPGTTFRSSVSYSYSQKQNQEILGGEKSTSHNVGLEAKFNKAGKGSMQINGNYIQIDYQKAGTDAAANTALAFEMLEGLQPGRNFTWTISIQRTIAKNIQLNLNYNGRSSEGSKVIHTAGVQVRAFF